MNKVVKCLESTSNVTSLVSTICFSIAVIVFSVKVTKSLISDKAKKKTKAKPAAKKESSGAEKEVKPASESSK